MGLHASLFVCRCPRWVQGLLIRGPKRMEPGEGPPVSSPDPAIIPSVEQPALSSTHVVTDMPLGSPTVQTHTLIQHTASRTASWLGIRLTSCSQKVLAFYWIAYLTLQPNVVSCVCCCVAACGSRSPGPSRMGYECPDTAGHAPSAPYGKKSINLHLHGDC